MSWQLHELEYLEAPGVSVLAFHNDYPMGRQGGVELIHHGERVATNGDIHLATAQAGYDNFSVLQKRQIDRKKNAIRADLVFKKPASAYSVNIVPAGQSIKVTVELTKAVPFDFPGKAFFSLEFFPATYFGKTFRLGKECGVFPREFREPILISRGEYSEPAAMGKGKKLYIAAEDPARFLTIESNCGELELIDVRAARQNGSFKVCSGIALGKTGKVAEWTITPHVIPGWRREPVIGVSQAGYHPRQKKQAVIELDPQTQKYEKAALLQITETGKRQIVLSAPLRRWGKYLRYEYAIFDFTSIKKPGLYRVKYGQKLTPPFRIDKEVYQYGVWQPTLETFFPVQMCHMQVRDRFRIWHGACHLDDALQAPTGHVHFDQYEQGPKTETKFAAFEHIPGLDQGGWHDAGDFDLAAGSQARTTYVLALAHEAFKPESDQTFIDQDKRQVVLHQPDGKPDILQQVEHGVLNLLSGYRAAGHSFCGIIESTRQQYVHLGDASTITDNKIYDPGLASDAVKENRAGAKDDRWAFTTRSTALEYQVAAALAASGRVLRGFNNALAEECISTAARVWSFEHSNPPVYFRCEYVPGDPEVQEIMAAIELLLTTNDTMYCRRLQELLPVIVKNIGSTGWAVARVLSRVGNKNFTKAVEGAVGAHADAIKKEMQKNPYGVLLRPKLWGMAWELQQQAMEFYYLIQAFPRKFDREMVLRVVNYALGCHPYSNVSLVSGVGPISMTMPFGSNRADWAYIPGGEPSGVALVKPDFLELKSNYPFLWQQAEYVISGAATYIFCVLAAQELLERTKNSQ